MIAKQPPPMMPGRIIPVESYPAMMRKSLASKAMFELRSERLKQHASEILSTSGEAMKGAVLKCVEEMESAGKAGDMQTVFAQAHEIRGMAATAGMALVGQIANGLCRYLDASEQAGLKVDAPLVALHLDAIVRAARSQDEANKLGGVVANELAQLAAKKLDGVKE